MRASTFRYIAVDAESGGRRVRGREAASDAATLSLALERRGLLVLDVAAVEEGSRSRPGGGTIRQVLEATRALAALLPAGLPLARALKAAEDLVGGSVGATLGAVRSNVERGQALAAALAEHPAVFPPLYVGLVRAGERSGNLDDAFTRLAAQLEREEELRGKLLSVSIYPIVLAIGGGLAVAVLLLWVMPRFVDLLQDTGATLPASTALLLAISGGLHRFWPLLLAFPAMVAVLLAWSRTTEEGRRGAAMALLSLPIVGTLRRHALGARFARLLGVLLGGGAPLLTALDDTIESLGDPLAQDEAARIRTQVREGVALHLALAHGQLFPPVLGQLVQVGEESGRLQEFTLKGAEILEERTTRILQRLVSLAEPAMIVGFGGLVGFVALSLLQAIYSVNAGTFR